MVLPTHPRCTDPVRLITSRMAEDEVYEAEKHLILGTRESAEVLARLLYEWFKQDEAHTAPTYIARAVFGYLLVGNLREARRSLGMFIGQLTQENSTLVIQEVQSTSADISIFPSLPLLNFLSLLSLATQTGGAEVFRNLKSHYATQLRDIPAWDDVNLPRSRFGKFRLIVLTGSRTHRRDVFRYPGPKTDEHIGHDGQHVWRRRSSGSTFTGSTDYRFVRFGLSRWLSSAT